MDGTLNTMVDWLATYSVHSTVLLLMAWAGDTWFRPRAQVASVVWKTALVGGALTASLQVGGAVEPLTGYLHVAPETAVATPAQAIPEAAFPSQIVAAIEPQRHVDDVPGGHEILRDTGEENSAYAWSLAAAPMTEMGEMSTQDVGTEAIVGASTPLNWRNLALAIWAVGGLLGLIRIARSWQGLSRQLRGRRTIVGSQVRQTFDDLCLAAGRPGNVRLTSTHRIDVPLAMGVTRPEVCVPRRVLRGLGADAQESLLAHELAHVVHHDPFWRLLGAAFEGLLFFQPLNRIANRKLGTYAEYLADEWAVSHTRQPLVLARCLTEVAGWVVRPASHHPVPAMASGQPSVLSHRVKRLLDFEAPAKPQRWLAGFASVAMFTGVVFIAPGVLGSPGEPVSPENDAPTLSLASEIGSGPGAFINLLPEGVLASSASGNLGSRVLAAANQEPGTRPAAPRGAGLTSDDPRLERALRRAERRKTRALKDKRRRLERLVEKAEKHQTKANAKAHKLEQKVDRAARDLGATQRGLSPAEHERERSRAAAIAAHRQQSHGADPTRDERVVYRYSSGGETVVIEAQTDGQLVVVAPDGRRYELDAHVPTKKHRTHGRHRVTHQHVHPEHRGRVVDTRDIVRRAREIEREVRKQLPDTREIERRAREIEREARRHNHHARAIEHEARKQRKLAREIEREVLKQLPDAREIERKVRAIEREAHNNNKRAAERHARELEAEIRKSLPNREQLRRQAKKLEREFGQKAERHARELEAHAHELEQKARELEQKARNPNIDPEQLRRKAREIEREAKRFADQGQRAQEKRQRKAQKEAQKVRRKARKDAQKARQKAAKKRQKQATKKTE